MTTAANIVVALVALLHLYFLVLEMFLWDKPKGLQVFGHSMEKAQATKLLASHQGLYNGFLAAGLLVGLAQGNDGFDFKVFFLSCVIVAGIYGGLTVGRKILFFQAAPAVVGLVLVWLSW